MNYDLALYVAICVTVLLPDRWHPLLDTMLKTLVSSCSRAPSADIKTEPAKTIATAAIEASIKTRQGRSPARPVPWESTRTEAANQAATHAQTARHQTLGSGAATRAALAVQGETGFAMVSQVHAGQASGGLKCSVADCTGATFQDRSEQSTCKRKKLLENDNFLRVVNGCRVPQSAWQAQSRTRVTPTALPAPRSVLARAPLPQRSDSRVQGKAGGDGLCTPCIPGTYAEDTGLSSCKSVGPGHYSSGSGNTIRTRCEVCSHAC